MTAPVYNRELGRDVRPNATAQYHCQHGWKENCPWCMRTEINRLRNGIQDYLDGNYGRDVYFKTKHDKCPHGLFAWEACEVCIDEHFSKLLSDETKFSAA